MSTLGQKPDPCIKAIDLVRCSERWEKSPRCWYVFKTSRPYTASLVVTKVGGLFRKFKYLLWPDVQLKRR